MSGAARFYVELPADKYGNVGKYPLAVVEARWYDCDSDAHPGYDTDRPYMVCVAPAETAALWPGWYADAAGGWAEVEGPARLLGEEEWKTLVAQVQARDTP